MIIKDQIDNQTVDQLTAAVKRGARVFLSAGYLVPVEKGIYQKQADYIIEEKGVREKVGKPKRLALFRECRGEEKAVIRTVTHDGRDIGLVPLEEG